MKDLINFANAGSEDTYTTYIATFTKQLVDGTVESHTLNFKSWERRALAIAYWKMKGYTATIL